MIHRSIVKRSLAVLAVLASLVNSACAHGNATFTVLDPLIQGQETAIADVSGDGLVGVGQSGHVRLRAASAVRWDLLTGRIAALQPSTGRISTQHSVNATNRDGSVVVGNLNLPGMDRAYRWTREDGFRLLVGLPEGAESIAMDVDDSGEFVVGHFSKQGERNSFAFSWSQQNGDVSLEFLETTDSPYPESVAYSVSADGRVVGGTTRGARLNSLVALWEQDNGRARLQQLTDAPLFGSVMDISPDGLALVGSYRPKESGWSPRAFHWTEADGLSNLGVLYPDDTVSEAHLLSADGRIVFGRSSGPGLDRGEHFAWYREAGMRSFRGLLEEDYHLADQLVGWAYLRPTGISSDGLTIVGNGESPAGVPQAWVLRLMDPIGVPEPTTAALVVSIGTLRLLLLRRVARGPGVTWVPPV